MQDVGYSSRGYLPHLHIPGATQFLTWRLHDSIPRGLLDEWKRALEGDAEAKSKLYRQLDSFLDEGHGGCYLRRPDLACAVLDHLVDGDNYIVHAAVVMPNHVHAVVTMGEGLRLSTLMHHIKGASAREINLKLNRSGLFWEKDYFDRVVRSPDHFERCVKYIHWNPVKAGLVEHPSWFAASTAHERFAARLKSRFPDAG
jgi:REP element-mobilizing transposase RayT